MEKQYPLILNQYQRDNLLWLLNCCGYPYQEGIRPFTFANTGDWLGEIAQMLKDENGLIPKGSNVTKEYLQKQIDLWDKAYDESK